LGVTGEEKIREIPVIEACRDAFLPVLASQLKDHTEGTGEAPASSPYAV
jgi:hypothetical protein